MNWKSSLKKKSKEIFFFYYFAFARLLDSCYNCGRSGTVCFWEECGHPQSHGHKQMRPLSELWLLFWALKISLQVYISPLELGRDQDQYLLKSFLCHVPGGTVIAGRAQILTFLMISLFWKGIISALFLHQNLLLNLAHTSLHGKMLGHAGALRVGTARYGDSHSVVSFFKLFKYYNFFSMHLSTSYGGLTCGAMSCAV